MILVIRAKTIGESITFTVERNNQTLEIVVVVGDLNNIN